MQRLRSIVPELALAFVALFFALRELGTFPRSWLDEGLFIMTAKTVAFGHGYGIPLLDHIWYYPYFLAVGPTIILPAALSIKLFGLSVAAARLPMTLYLLATCVVLYRFTARTFDRASAFFATALLVTLSAFVNTGKPVLGEVPGFLFLLLGFFAMERARTPVRAGLLSGVFFGLAILTKLTYGLVLPALALAWIVAVLRREWKHVGMLTLSGALAVIVYLPWRLVEIAHTPSAGSLTQELGKSLLGTGTLPFLNVLRNNREILTQLPFLAFCLFLALGVLGLWLRRAKLMTVTKVAMTTVIALFLFYYLDSFGWYRHLLAAHLLLIPFVPAGAVRLLKLRAAAGMLGVIVLLQGIWQWNHEGAGKSEVLQQTVAILEQNYQTTDLLIDAAEVYAQLPENPHWLYLVPDGVSPTMPAEFQTPSTREACFARVTRLTPEDAQALGARVQVIGGYHLVQPPPGCFSKKSSMGKTF